MSNIFVNPSNPTDITSIIDWQSASIEPAFAFPMPIPNLALPVDYLVFIQETEQGREMTTPQIWDATLKACLHVVPHIGPLMQIDEDIFKLFRTCHRTWRDGTASLTPDLIDLTGRWKVLGLPGSPRYTPPAGEELKLHDKRWAEFTDSKIMPAIKFNIGG